MSDSTTGAPGDATEGNSLEARQIGHDLNNCLGIVRGRAELALVQLDRGNAEAARKGLQAIVDQMDKMSALADSLRGRNDSA